MSFSKILVTCLALLSIFVLWRSINLVRGYFSKRHDAFERQKGPEPRIMDLVVCKSCGAYMTATARYCGKCGAKMD
ncbi:MAG: zinc-ribbon domain-containing protein [Pseudomonadota bacterium]